MDGFWLRLLEITVYFLHFYILVRIVEKTCFPFRYQAFSIALSAYCASGMLLWIVHTVHYGFLFNLVLFILNDCFLFLFLKTRQKKLTGSSFCHVLLIILFYEFVWFSSGNILTVLLSPGFCFFSQSPKLPVLIFQCISIGCAAGAAWKLGVFLHEQQLDWKNSLLVAAVLATLAGMLYSNSRIVYLGMGILIVLILLGMHLLTMSKEKLQGNGQRLANGVSENQNPSDSNCLESVLEAEIMEAVRIHHDFRAITVFLEDCLQNDRHEEALEYLHSLASDVKQPASGGFTNCSSLDRLLSDFVQNYPDIAFHFEIQDAVLKRFALPDLLRAANNLLSNAVKELTHHSELEQRIWFSLRQTGDTVRIICSNPFDQEEPQGSISLLHGCGLQFLDNFAQANHGSLHISRSSDFTVTLVFDEHL